MNSPEDLYQKILLQHHREPKHERVMKNYACSESAYNPLCGDKITIFIDLDSGLIKESSFTAEGCAISRASSSILTEHLIGKSCAEAREFVLNITDLLKSYSKETLNVEMDEDLNALLEVRKFTARIPCATLAWIACIKALELLD